MNKKYKVCFTFGFHLEQTGGKKDGREKKLKKKKKMNMKRKLFVSPNLSSPSFTLPLSTRDGNS